jgi:hypothetical protein
LKYKQKYANLTGGSIKTDIVRELDKLKYHVQKETTDTIIKK